MKLFTLGMSPNGKRVEVCAAELGLKLERIAVDPSKGENKTNDYLAKNPMGKVPTLVDDDGYTLWESMAISQYLCDKSPGKLVPNDAKGRAEVTRWTFWNACHLEKATFAMASERWLKPTFYNLPPDEKLVEMAQKELDRYLPVLNGQLEGKDWITGQFSLADVSLGVTVELLPMVKVDLAPYPHIRAWLGRLQGRDSWKAYKA